MSTWNGHDRRLWIAGALCALLAPGCAPRKAAPPAVRPTMPAAPAQPAPVVEAPKPAEPPIYPHEPESVWFATAVSGAVASPVRWTIASSHPADGGERFEVVTTQAAQVVQHETYRLTHDGLFCENVGPEGKAHYQPPLPVVQLPLKPGARWHWIGVYTDPNGSAPAEVFAKLSGPEPRRIGQVNLQAYRVDQTLTLKTPDTPQTIRTSLWFAPGAGLVAQVVNDGTQKTTTTVTQYQLGSGKPATPTPMPVPPTPLRPPAGQP